MAVVQKAIGIAWGMGAGFTFTAVATPLKVKPLSANYQRNAQMVEMPDQNGEAVGLVFWNPTEEIDLRVYPSDTTLAAAITAAGTCGLNVGDKVVIADTDDPDIAGTYVCLKVGKARKVDSHVEFDITLKAWATDLSTTTS